MSEFFAVTSTEALQLAPNQSARRLESKIILRPCAEENESSIREATAEITAQNEAQDRPHADIDLSIGMGAWTYVCCKRVRRLDALFDGTGLDCREYGQEAAPIQTMAQFASFVAMLIFIHHPGARAH